MLVRENIIGKPGRCSDARKAREAKRMERAAEMAELRDQGMAQADVGSSPRGSLRTVKSGERPVGHLRGWPLISSRDQAPRSPHGSSSGDLRNSWRVRSSRPGALVPGERIGSIDDTIRAIIEDMEIAVACGLEEGQNVLGIAEAGGLTGLRIQSANPYALGGR